MLIFNVAFLGYNFKVIDYNSYTFPIFSISMKKTSFEHYSYFL